MKIVVAIANCGSRLFIAAAREDSTLHLPKGGSCGYFIKDQDIFNYMFNKFPNLSQKNWTLIDLDEDL